MKMNMLATAAALSDDDLLGRLHALAGREREASVELVAHLAALDIPPAAAAAEASGLPESAPAPSPAALLPSPRPIVQATAPERYRVQFTIGPATHEKLRRVQALLRREIPDGDPGEIFDRALSLLLEKVEKTKLGAMAQPRPSQAIRLRTDGNLHKPSSRHIPRAVKGAVWRRDGGQCAFVSADGRRCTERTFLEFHHVLAYAKQGPATVANISLRCRRHNQFESELIFGPYGASMVREGASLPP
jgi:hypothetical protein